MKRLLHLLGVGLGGLLLLIAVGELTRKSLSVEEDPLIRMPGTQPSTGVVLEDVRACMACHSNYNPDIEPGFNWQGSMMAQAARDFLFWPAMAVAGQDSQWATGRPVAMDLCLRCHMPGGWLAGRSEPVNATAMTGPDFDGVQCDMCHRMYDPFFEDTFRGVRESDDWLGYWDESGASSTPAREAAEATYEADKALAETVALFNGRPFFGPDNQPVSEEYTENAGGQYFVSRDPIRRGPFADANELFHPNQYSRYHRSKFFCGTCHDVSNAVLANLDFAGARPGFGNDLLPSERLPAHAYFHIERTFSEFMLSAFGEPGGAPGSGPYAPDVFNTSHPENYIASCQDCHMPDVSGRASNIEMAVDRPGGSIEHPHSGLPLHDLTGGNAFVPYVLASAVEGSPNYDPVNAALLRQGPEALTLDLEAGLGLNPKALLAGAERAKEQLRKAAALEHPRYDAATGALSFRVVNQTGHKLISGYPEGRRMFLNIRMYSGDRLVHEVNPYDDEVGTLKGLDVPSSPPLGPDEHYEDALVYEVKQASSLTNEDHTFHMALATHRYKDNRIPPKGFRIDEAPERLSEPAWEGQSALDYFTAEEYAGGYDDVELTVPAGAERVEIRLYYQTTSREYIEFLRDQINGVADTLPSEAYIIQNDPFFAQLRAWGDTVWQLWEHNKDVPGAAPVLMVEAVAEAG